MDRINIPVSRYEELIKTEANLYSLLAYLNSEEGKFPKIEIIRAIAGGPKNEKNE